MHLSNRTIIVTGASSGIGRAAAMLFARQGADLVLSARRAPLLADLTREIAARGGRAVYLASDIQKEETARDLAQLALDRFGRLDAAFNNAGITGDLGPIPEMASETWQQVLAVNLDSAFFAAKHQIPLIRAAGGGSVVFTSSFVGQGIGLPGMGAYAAAKAGIVGLVQVLAAEHGSDGVRVNALLPGGTRTPMAGEDPATLARIEEYHALRRMAGPDEIAQAALFLVSDQSSFVTGSALLVDGGNSILKA